MSGPPACDGQRSPPQESAVGLNVNLNGGMGPDPGVRRPVTPSGRPRRRHAVDPGATPGYHRGRPQALHICRKAAAATRRGPGHARWRHATISLSPGRWPKAVRGSSPAVQRRSTTRMEIHEHVARVVGALRALAIAVPVRLSDLTKARMARFGLAPPPARLLGKQDTARHPSTREISSKHGGK